MQRFTFIDLFCGCGGFSLGMERAGFECLAALYATGIQHRLWRGQGFGAEWQQYHVDDYQRLM